MLVHCSISACLRSCAAARSGTTISGKARDRSAGKPPPIFRAARGGALSGRLDVGARFGGDSAATSAFTICSTSNCEYIGTRVAPYNSGALCGQTFSNQPDIPQCTGSVVLN